MLRTFCFCCGLFLIYNFDSIPTIKMSLMTFHFSKNMYLFSKWVFEMCFHFQNVKDFVNTVFSFFRNTQLRTKICTFTTNSFTDEVMNKKQNIYIKLLNLFQLSRIYDLSYHWWIFPRHGDIDPNSCMEYWNTRSSESQFINVNGFLR